MKEWNEVLHIKFPVLSFSVSTTLVLRLPVWMSVCLALVWYLLDSLVIIMIPLLVTACTEYHDTNVFKEHCNNL